METLLGMPAQRQWQQQVIAVLGVKAEFDAVSECERRIGFLSAYLREAALDTYVLGISGGVDSATAGRLAQLSVERLRQDGYNARFLAVRLPYGSQIDEADAQVALSFICPDETFVVNVRDGADGLLTAVRQAGVQFAEPALEDFALGNIKARQRMVAQYAIANARRGLVVGTDHAAEAVMGFYTKYGDGGADVLPLAGLTKRRVRALARALEAPERIVAKVPTADLESLAPQKPDEQTYGITYDDIDDFLEGNAVNAHAFETIWRFYLRSKHKRALPVAPRPHRLARLYGYSRAHNRRPRPTTLGARLFRAGTWILQSFRTKSCGWRPGATCPAGLLGLCRYGR